MKHKAEVLKIAITYTDETSREDAIDEAVKRIKQGNVFGMDRNENGSFRFDVIKVNDKTDDDKRRDRLAEEIL